jgi:nitrogen fixation/metabolism regulation signal transduction histidine kinase
LREQIASPLRTLANLLEAMREGDYSIRARANSTTSALDEVHEQINAMGATLQEQRLGALEATALLRKVMEEINVAIFAFNNESKLRLANKAAAALMRRPMERLLGATASELGLDDFLLAPVESVTRTFPGGGGRWGANVSSFREGGAPHHLLVLTDLTRPLREEELQAWQRLVRVLGHELNNSLAPIKSIAGSLSAILDRDPLAEDWREDMRHGLNIVGSRADSLQRFLGAYDQIEQALINLLKNAVEAGPPVTISWSLVSVAGGRQLEIAVRDQGPGLSNTANLFVPFFTTKPGGSGIGLVLCRQIAEGHGGTLELRNAESGRGCVARLTLPLADHDPSAAASGA